MSHKPLLSESHKEVFDDIMSYAKSKKIKFMYGNFSESVIERKSDLIISHTLKNTHNTYTLKQTKSRSN